MEKSDGRSLHVAFSRDPVESDWERFVFYARRVKILRVQEILTYIRYWSNQTALEPISREVLRHLHFSENIKLVFPRLISLDLSLCSASSQKIILTYPSVFLGEQLSSLKLNWIDDTNSHPMIMPFMAKVVEVAPSLERLHLPLSLSAELCMELASVLSSFVKLRHIYLTTVFLRIPLHILQCCTSMVNLETLELDIRIRQNIVDPLPGPMSLHFLSLRVLTLRLFSPSTCKDILAAIHAPHLSELSILTRTCAGTEECLEIICDRSPPWPLTDLTIRFSSSQNNPCHDRLEAHTLEKLTHFPGLKTIFIIVNCVIALDDPTLATVAQGLPCLEDLRIYQFLENESTGLLISSFLHLARHCPRLHNVALHVDSRNLDVTTATSAGRMGRQTQLRSAFLGQSPVAYARPAQVAAFLTGVFPNLTKLTGLSQERRDGLPSGQALADLLLLMRSIRQEERTRAETERTPSRPDLPHIQEAGRADA